MNIKNKLLPSVLLFGVLTVGFLAGCTSDHTANNAHMNHGDTETAPDSKEAKYTLELQTAPEKAKANEPVQLTFSVKDQNGGLVKELDIVHEKPMHLLVVSTDLDEFYHIHPEPTANGVYRVEHTFPNGGDYRLYADFTPPKSKQVVERIELNVEGPKRADKNLVADSKLEKVVDGLKVTMKPSGVIKAGAELTLDFAAFDAASGRPATDLENYRGELAHFVIISEDLVDFVHAHPMSKGEKTEGMKMDGDNDKDHGADGHSHGVEKNEAKKASGSEVSAHTTFPRPGIYKLWAQFQRNDKVITVPFIVNAPPGDTASVKAPNVPAGATQITVSSDGYEPSSISVKKGVPLKLAFYRADGDNCGGEVVFAKHNIRKKLPVGETVVVDITPKEIGEIAFACGMDMMNGKLVVTEN